MDEPTVWDYVKAKLTPWRGPAPTIPSAFSEDGPRETLGEFESPEASAITERSTARVFQSALPKVTYWPWRSFIALTLALAAQLSLEVRPNRTYITGIILYAVSVAWLFWAYWRGEWKAAPIPKAEVREDPLTVRSNLLVGGLAVSILAYLTLGGNHFTRLNFTLWIAAILLSLASFWLGGFAIRSGLANLRSYLNHPVWKIKITRWGLLVFAVFAVAVFFRIYHISQTPPEMFSDHAENLLDVNDLLNGQAKIFFEHNAGREAIQFYLTALISKLFGVGLTFASLKIGSIFAGIAVLPFIYLIGKEIANRRVGLLAMLFAGIAYWPNVISRIGLSFPLYALFTAPTLYFFLRGIRRSNRNDYLLAGLFLGLGLHGYSPARVLPLVVAAGVGLYLIHRASQGIRRQTLLAALTLGWVSLVVYLPLLRYITDPQHPEQRTLYLSSTLTRLTSLERPLPGLPLQIFLNNLGHALVMFTWNNGEIWSSSIPLRPALDVVSAALFMLGAGLLLIRYLRERHWLDLFLLLSVPLLMLPSILALAFPSENPNLNQTIGAIVPVFLILGIALDGLLSAVTARLSPVWNAKAAKITALALAVFLFCISANQNYDLVFQEFTQQYAASAWNTSEMGKILRDFAGFTGTPDTGFVIPYPYWVDTRLVGIEAGFPTKDYAISPDSLADTRSNPNMKLFLVKPEDQKSQDELRSLYPGVIKTTYQSKYPGKDFLLFLVPAQNAAP
jgi:4-amino-4-deoxy-L-arabinose transferase-like glycosyltransferase